MTLLEQRDAILDSLKCQLQAKVSSIRLKDGAILYVKDHKENEELNRLLLDLANNAAQAIAE